MSRFPESRVIPRVAFVLIILVTGCREESTGVFVEGKLSIRETPLPGGSVMFYPTEGRSISAIITDEGTYQCHLPAGTYRVTITSSVTLPAGWEEGDPLPKPAVEIPANYSSRRKTPLEVTVSENQTDPINLDLE